MIFQKYIRENFYFVFFLFRDIYSCFRNIEKKNGKKKKEIALIKY